ncbi:MAG: hypothetical protein ACI4N3_02090, partial [Alphaproteobacteria bacterium]
MFKKSIAFLTIFAFVGQIFSLPVFSQTKKKTVRSASSKRSASSARSSRSKGSRSLGSSRALSRIATTSSTTSTGSNCLAQFIDCMDAQIDPIISNYAYLSDDEAVQAMQETKDPLRCIYYNSANVKGLFVNGDSKYCTDESILAERKGVSIDTTTGGVKSKKTNKEDKFNNLNFCSNQRDINDLYMSYNYYCDLDESAVGVSGMPINKCNLKKATSKSNDGKTGNNKTDVFATNDSYAYYNEANRRVEAGELKIINFEQTNLFKNKIAPLGLENWDRMSLTSGSTEVCKNANGSSCSKGSADCICTIENSVSDLLSDLGLGSNSNGSELFSINVVPPVGAGNLNPGSQYEKARNICFGMTTFKIAGKTATDNENTIKSAINYLSANCTSPAVRTDLERYYIAGTAVKPCDDDYVYNAASNKCIYTGSDTDTTIEAEKEPHTSDEEDVELEQTDFLSAKASCDLYEQTLISTRNKAYADF